MKPLRIFLIILLIVLPFPFGMYLVNSFFYDSSKSDLFYGDITINETPADYYPKDRGFWFSIPDGPCAGMKMFYRDSIHGKGRPDNTIVFVHGNPASSYTFKKTIDELLTRLPNAVRIISMDHIGFGLSDRAETLLTPKNHADNLLQLFKYLDVYNIILVVHDWGGPIGMGAFLNIPETVSSLVVINSIAFSIPDPEFILDKYPVHIFDNNSYSIILPDVLYGEQAAFNILCPKSAGFFHKLGFMKEILFPPKNVVDTTNNTTAIKFYSNHLQTVQNIENSKFLYKQARILPREHQNRVENSASETEELFTFIQKTLPVTWGENGRYIPTYGIFGELDILSNEMFVYRWKEFMPQLEGCIETIDNAGHQIQEEHPDIVASHILRALFRLKEATDKTDTP